MARVLIVGCGCRGRQLASALRAQGHAVRGTTREELNLAAIEAAGAEALVADPNRLGTLLPHIEGVAVLYWLMGGATGAVHGPRLQSLLEQLVDTPVRGFVYEGTAEGAAIARAAEGTFRIPVAVLDPGHAEWLEEATAASGRVLDRPRAVRPGWPER